MYQGCTCPEHQNIYQNWPAKDAILQIPKCMRNCPNCNKQYNAANSLRAHIRFGHFLDNLTVEYRKEHKTWKRLPGFELLDPRKAHEGCTCSSHKHIYAEWPARNAQLTISKCMRKCPSCGQIVRCQEELACHIREVHRKDNLRVEEGVDSSYVV